MPRDKEDRSLIPPEPEEKTKLDEIIELYDRAAAEFKTTKEREYWQGRKDGLRAALAILEPEESLWDMLNKSSHGFRVEEKEALLKFLEDARYNVGAALWEVDQKERIHSQTRINLERWVDSYDRKAKAGEVLPPKNAIHPRRG
jgi:hypothetical protein